VLQLFCCGFSQVGKLEGCLQTLKYIVKIFGDFLKMTNFKVPMGKMFTTSNTRISYAN